MKKTHWTAYAIRDKSWDKKDKGDSLFYDARCKHIMIFKTRKQAEKEIKEYCDENEYVARVKIDIY
jgi:hypothetical protein